MYLLGYACARRCGIRGLGLFILTLALLRRAGKVGIFENGEQLTLLYMAAALHVKLADRRSDLRRNHGLLQRRDYRFYGNGLLDGTTLRPSHLDRDDRFRLFLGATAAGQQSDGREQKRRYGETPHSDNCGKGNSAFHGLVSTPVSV